MPTLYIVATPIGNLEDISLRAIRILGEAAFVLCEDTRVTSKLLAHYKIKTPTIAYHQHSDEKRTAEVLKLLEQGKDLALVADAGTPGISDPGGKLVQAVIEKFGGGLSDVGALRAMPLQPGIKTRPVRIESVPGPSALTAALSISGIPTDKFVFLGLPPHKKGRQTFIERVADSVYPVVVYESKHRIKKFLEELKELNKRIETRNKEIAEEIARLPYNGKRRELEAERHAPVTSVVVCRELSKMHETVYRGDLDFILEQIKQNSDDQRGEFTVVIGK